MSTVKRLERMEKKQEELRQKIADERAKLTQLERKRDTRRKIVIGAVVMSAVEAGEWDRASLQSLLSKHVRRPIDRELFGLEPQ